MEYPTHPPRSGLQTYGAFSNMQDTKERLQQAINGAFPAKLKPYNNVLVLYLTWDAGASSRHFIDEAHRFEKFLRGTYNYNGYQINLQSTVSSLECIRQMTNALTTIKANWDDKDHLIIIYYSGHASNFNSLNQTEGCTFSAANPNFPVTELPFEDLRHIFKYCVGDVLYILDCCYAQRAALGGSNELIAASDDVSTTRAYNPSLTEALIDKMAALATQGAYTAMRLCGEILGDPKYHSRIRPHYCQQAADPISSIQLAPLRPPSQPSASPRPAPVVNHKVILEMTFEDDLQGISIDQFKTWITTNLPSHVKSLELISLHAAFRTSSITMYVSMDISVWLGLREHPALRFLRFASEDIFDPGFRQI